MALRRNQEFQASIAFLFRHEFSLRYVNINTDGKRSRLTWLDETRARPLELAILVHDMFFHKILDAITMDHEYHSRRSC